jgi:Tfp pilus assembly PilM family ATPase
VAAKERQVKQAALLPLPPGLVEPHFDRKNVAEAEALAGVLKEAQRKLHIAGKWVACLLPESCLKVLVMSFDALPSSPAERDQVVRWRVKKQLPVIPDDARLSYEVTNSGQLIKVVLAVARKAVVEEYEALFAEIGLKVGMVSAPTLSLLNLIEGEKEEDLLVVNIEDDSLGLAAVTQSDLALYRHKVLGGAAGRQSIETIAKEIENTVHFIEDRERREVRALWLHASAEETASGIVALLGERFAGSIRLIDPPQLASLSPRERPFLAPLVGQIL